MTQTSVTSTVAAVPLNLFSVRLCAISSDKGRECTRARAAKTRDARNEGDSRERLFCASSVSRLEPHAWSFSSLARFARQTKKNERLLSV